MVAQTIQHKIEIDAPNLWWPNGMGKPNLYGISIELKKGNQLLDSKTDKFGIRTVELIQEKDMMKNAFGEKWYEQYGFLETDLNRINF